MITPTSPMLKQNYFLDFELVKKKPHKNNIVPFQSQIEIEHLISAVIKKPPNN